MNKIVLFIKKYILWIGIGILCLLILGIGSYFIFFREKVVSINIEKLLLEKNKKIKVYEKDNFEEFLKDYQDNKLDEVYVTKFLFDGAGMYKAPDLDDFIEKGNDMSLKVLETTVINFHTLGNYQLTGELKGGMIAVNTNGLKGNVNLILDNVSLDTDSKKIPAIYVYHKDITNSDCHVSINTKKNTTNIIEGGKLKKVSLVSKEEFENYKDKYSGDTLTTYEAYSNYYGIYTKEEISNIIFATTTADREDLADGDPYFYYKASGAISSDIDLYFKGKGNLQVTSKNKEGIESKGNLSLIGGSGDYVVYSKDDCLNTTTDYQENKNAHNAIEIDVHSLAAIVLTDADEGDAIDSNGTLTINGGTIVALSQFGADSGLDSEQGTFINKGEVIATASMMDQVSANSKQRYVMLSTSQDKDSIITMLDNKNKVVFSFKSDRKYSTLVYSSPKLKNKTYHFYQEGSIEGKDFYGLYTSGKYTMGTQLGYTTKSSNTGMGGPGQMGPGGGQPPQGMNGVQPPLMPNGEQPQMPEGMEGQQPPQRQPGGSQGESAEPPAMPDGVQPPEMPNGQTPPEMNGGQPPQMPDGQTPPEMNGGQPPQTPGEGGMIENSNATNADFVIDGISNIFSGVGKLIKE